MQLGSSSIFLLTLNGKEIQKINSNFLYRNSPVGNLRRQNVEESGGGQSPHGVVLDGTSGQVSVCHEGEVVDCPDESPEVFFIVGGVHHVLEVLQLGGVHSPVPLQLVLALVFMYKVKMRRLLLLLVNILPIIMRSSLCSSIQELNDLSYPLGPSCIA